MKPKPQLQTPFPQLHNGPFKILLQPLRPPTALGHPQLGPGIATLRAALRVQEGDHLASFDHRRPFCIGAGAPFSNQDFDQVWQIDLLGEHLHAHLSLEDNPKEWQYAQNWRDNEVEGDMKSDDCCNEHSDSCKAQANA